MKFKLKELPKVVDWSELLQFTIIKEDGSELEMRRMERMGTEGIEYWMFDNDEWTCALKKDGQVRHFNSSQIKLWHNGTYDICKPMAEKQKNEL